MSEQVERRKTLEERVTEKLHEQIGDLLTPEDLQMNGHLPNGSLS